MTKSISSKLLALLLLSCLFVFQACTKDDDNPQPLSENKYLTGVTAERRLNKTEVIAVLNTISPVDISTTPLALMITDMDVVAITYITTGVDGKKTEASGIVAMCKDTKEYDN